MNIRTSNVPYDLLSFTRILVKFYEDNFLKTKGIEEVKVAFGEIDDCIATTDYVPDEYRPTFFTIEFSNDYRDIKPNLYATTIFHEMAHVDQYASGRLKQDRAGNFIWNKAKYKYVNLLYHEHPWEIEAYGIEQLAMLKFLDEHGSDYGLQEPRLNGRKRMNWRVYEY